mgnify:CR=1 FL=1
MNRDYVSAATINNWERLGIDEENLEKRLSKRANKRFSSKNILPTEYLSSAVSVDVFSELIKSVKAFSSSNAVIIYNFALKLLVEHALISISEGKISSDNPYLLEILDFYPYKCIDNNIFNLALPYLEGDVLGGIYQSLLTEGYKNKQGSYYTPAVISKQLVESLKSNNSFLDPCCGTGSFLLSASDVILDPSNLFGCDIDEIACFIAKINLIIRYKDKQFRPNIYNIDFLLDKSTLKKKFDVIATNPPWGAIPIKQYEEFYSDILSRESFSYFIVKSFSLLKDNGKSIFVLPESILNVAVHRDIRKFILSHFNIESIDFIGKPFSGVLTDTIILKLNKSLCHLKNSIILSKENKKFVISQEVYKKNSNYNFSFMDNKDDELLTKIYKHEHLTLKDSLWALGIVTGDNKKYVTDTCKEGYERIYTGKDIQRYKLLPATKFIDYDRDKFQQVASEEIYRAKEKLVYKFISKKLVFAYDNQANLFLNSANILIPNINGYSVKTVLAFLNSELFQYIYMKKFDELKILKGNLLHLPFPILADRQNLQIETFVNNYLKTYDVLHLEKIDDIIYSIFGLDITDILYIKKEICFK